MLRIRWDIAIALVLSALIGVGTLRITAKVLDAGGQGIEHTEEVITDKTVGARAEPETPRLESVEEMRDYSGLFTFESGNRYNQVRGDYDTEHMEEYNKFNYVLLDNGEYVIVKVFDDSVVYESVLNDLGIPKGKYIMPIGVVVKEPAPQPVLDYVLEYYDIADTSFYIDMCGTHTAAKTDTSVNKSDVGQNVMLIAMFSSFFIIRFIGVKVGLFPSMFRKKKKA